MRRRRSFAVTWIGSVLGLAVPGVWACSDGTGRIADLDATGGTSANGGTSGADGGTGNRSADGGDPSEGGTGSGTRAGVGEACSEDSHCRDGLRCENDACAPSGTAGKGEPCTIARECEDGQCVAGTCQEAGDGEADAPCESDGDCQVGLRCVMQGLAASCQPEGDADVGAECEASTDCFAGLQCVQGRCAQPPPGSPFGGLPFPGDECAPKADPPVRAYFEVPGAPDADEHDFFRLPFPNDVRVTNRGLDLDGFPTPGAGVLGFDAVARYVEALEGERGFGTDPTVYFRFSNWIDPDSLREGTVHFVDVTPGADEYGDDVWGGWMYSSEKTRYICDSWIAIRRPRGVPLTPGHVYAVYLTTAVVDTNGDPVVRAPNLEAVLAEEEPDDATLRRAHRVFEPFREYLAAEDIDPDTILNATVFTVADVREPMAQLADAVLAADVPTATEWTLCDAGVESPCPQRDGNRGCQAANDAFDEYHALVELPIFQEGTPPYATPQAGGGIVTDAPVRTEPVCLSLTVPKAPMPEDGWPLVVFAHGTGGSFRSHVRPEVAGALSDAPVPGGDRVRFAVLGIDQVAHGPRRRTSKAEPDQLFFNFVNPAAARGNPLQGAADQLALARFAAELDVTVDGTRIAIDPTRLFFFGHSQGSTHGSLMLPYSDAYKAAVLSGNGASLHESLRHKTSPTNVAALFPFVLGDPDAAQPDLAVNHPVLALLQQWIDPADPLNFARALADEPIEPHAPRHVFQTYGLRDTFSPPTTLEAFALAGRFAWVENSGFEPDPIGWLEPVEAPLAGNRNQVTLGVRQYEPRAGSDGHFVVFDVEQANADVVRFFAMAASGEVPQIGE